MFTFRKAFSLFLACKNMCTHENNAFCLHFKDLNLCFMYEKFWVKEEFTLCFLQMVTRLSLQVFSYNKFPPLICVRVGGDIHLAAWARGEPPMIDCCFVQGDQSLAPTKRANQNLVHKTPPYSLLGHDFSGPALWTGEPRPGAQTPIKLCTA